MAFNLENMSVDYKSLLRLVPTQRLQVAQSGAINDLISALTPGQMVNLFPRYYKEQLPDVGLSAPSIRGAMTNATGYRPAGGGGTAQPYTPPPQLKTTMTPEQKAVQEMLQEAKVGQYADLPKGKIGLYRPAYTLSEADLSDQVIRTIAGEARLSSKEGVDAVINVMLNRVGSEQYGSNLLEVAAQGQGTRAVQFEGFNKGKVTEEQAEFIRQRIKVLASGAEPDNTFGANEFRGDYYVFGEGRGKDFYRDAERQGFVNIGGNIFAARGNYTGPYQGYDQIEVQKRIKQMEIESASQNIQAIETAMGKFEAGMIDQLDARLQNYYKNADPIQQRYIEEALGKLGVERFNENMKNQPINSPTLKAVASYSDAGPIPNAALDPNAVGGKRRIPLTEYESGVKILNRMNWVSEQASAETGEKISYRVFSALQPPGRNSAERGGEGTGGYRHGSDVGAADIELLATDAEGKTRVINAYSEGRDKEILQTALKYIGKSGFTGVGIGKDYQNGNLHVGFGDPHLWNSEEKGDPMRSEYAEFIRQGQQEAADQGFDFDAYYAERLKKHEEEMARKISNEAEALRTADPVSAARANQEKLEQESKSNAIQTPPPNIATGGTVIPGEDIAGVNLNTGDVEFMANSRERIRIDPAELENTQQMPTVTREDTQRLEIPDQAAMQAQKPRPTYVENPDPNFYMTMAEGQASIPPSQIRATNRAKMYGETSSNMVNGHFA